MWKQPSDSPTDDPARALTDTNQSETTRVKVRLFRPDGSSRDVVVAGHFREEHLCSLVDDELCRLANGETLTIHLYNIDAPLSQSLRRRWREGLSDNRRVRVREVLAPTGSPEQLARQLKDVHRRIASGERVSLAICSAKVAQLARRHLRKLLLLGQQTEKSRLRLWVHGTEKQQRSILDYFEDTGMVRADDFEQFAHKHPDRRWRSPWLDLDMRKHTTKPRHHHRPRRSKHETVDAWIRRVEKARERASHS